MQGVEGLSTDTGVRVLVSPTTRSTVENPAFDVEPSAVLRGRKGSGLLDSRDELARSPLPPAAMLYVESFGWPVSIVDGSVMVTCGDVVDITTMPAGFAGEVNQLLRLHILRAPIMELAAADEPPAWAFVSQPRRPTRNDQLEKLSGVGVKHFGSGTKFPLPPSPTCRGDGLSWRVLPPFGALTTPLPPWQAIVSCALNAQYRSTGR